MPVIVIEQPKFVNVPQFDAAVIVMVAAVDSPAVRRVFCLFQLSDM